MESFCYIINCSSKAMLAILRIFCILFAYVQLFWLPQKAIFRLL